MRDLWAMIMDIVYVSRRVLGNISVGKIYSCRIYMRKDDLRMDGMEEIYW